MVAGAGIIVKRNDPSLGILLGAKHHTIRAIYDRPTAVETRPAQKCERM